MNKEQLIALGLTEEQATKVVEGFGAMIPKSRFDEINNAKNQLETDIVARDKQLEELKETAGTIEDLKKQIQTAQDKNKTDKEQHDAELKDFKMTNAIKFALKDKVHDEEMAIGQIDKEKLVIGDDGKIVGLDEQLTSLQESKAFLFKTEEVQQQQQQTPPPGFKVGGDGKSTPPADKPISLQDAIAARFSANTTQ